MNIDLVFCNASKVNSSLAARRTRRFSAKAVTAESVALPGFEPMRVGFRSVGSIWRVTSVPAAPPRLGSEGINLRPGAGEPGPPQERGNTIAPQETAVISSYLLSTSGNPGDVLGSSRRLLTPVLVFAWIVREGTT